ncbi:MAG: MFS transporter [Actinobacteria bacterium]|nr:MFS transporter [Actinomycetota bacterium]
MLEGANLASGLGNAVVLVALPWLVLEITGSPSFTGVVAAASALPALLMAPLSGWLVDHVGRRAVSIGSDILSALSVAAIPIVAIVGGLTPTTILLLAVLGAAFDPAGYTARRTLLVDAARAAHMDQHKLNGIHEGVFAVGFVLGPVVGAAAITAIGPTNAFWIPFGLFLIAALSITCMRVTALAEEVDSSSTVGWRGLTRGFVVLSKDRLLLTITIGVLVLAAIYLPTEAIVLPTYFEARDEPGSLGMVIAALSAGAMIGAFLYGWISARLSTKRILQLIMIGTAVSILPMAFLPPLPILLAAGFLLGFFWGPFNPLMTTLVQDRVPADEQGRVFGVQLSVFYAAPPLGMIIVGYTVETWGVATTYLVLAGTLAITSITVLFARSVRQLPASRLSR